MRRAAEALLAPTMKNQMMNCRVRTFVFIFVSSSPSFWGGCVCYPTSSIDVTGESFIFVHKKESQVFL